MNKLINKFKKPVYSISRVCRNISAVMLAAMVVLIGIEVLFRYAFARPIKGVTDIVELLMVIFIFLTVAEVAIDKEHVNVKLVFSHFPQKVQTVMSAIVSLASFLIFALIAWQLGDRGWGQLLKSTLPTPTIEIPIGPFLLIAAFGSLLLALVLLIDTIKSIRNFNIDKLEH